MSARKYRAVAASAAAVVLLGAFEPVRWKYRSSLEIPPGAELVSVRLTRDIYARSEPGLPDLRVMREDREVPFLLEARNGSVQEKEQNAEVVNKEVAPAAGLRLTLDLGPGVKHSRVRLRTPEKNFRQLVRIETSNDNRRWAIVRDDAWIFHFSHDGRGIEVLSVDYPVSTRRYLRLSLPGWSKPDSVSGASAWYREAHPAEVEVMASLTPQPVEEPDMKSTRYDFDLRVKGLPHDRLRIEAGESFFHRGVELATSEDGRNWKWLGNGVIYRLPGIISDTVMFPETHDRYLRLRVFNQDNSPVRLSLAEVATVARYLTFEARSEAPYWLLFGNPNADRPVYDLGLILARRPVQPVPAGIGAPEQNPGYQPEAGPRQPWTERYPVLLYAILGAAVLGMGYVTIRFLRKVVASPQDS